MLDKAWEGYLLCRLRIRVLIHRTQRQVVDAIVKLNEMLKELKTGVESVKTQIKK